MTTDWTAGYVTDVNYTAGYYTDLNPLRSRLPLAAAGFDPPKVRTACELGFGQGLSLAMHAAAQPGVEWWGTDFNPTQAGFAQSMLDNAGVNAHVFDQAFEEFCLRDDLPQFDFIALHGTWSWVSDANRHIIVDFIRRKLRLGGCLFISYNAHPAWAQSMPLRHLMKLHADTMGSPGQGTVSKIDSSIEFIERLFATTPNHLITNPTVVARLKVIKGQNRAYLAHEYMNRDWSPMAFSDVEAWLADGKVEFACSADPLDQLPQLQLKAEQIAMLAEIPDKTLRETVRDFCVNRQFRRDYWLRGLHRLHASERHGLIQRERVVLTAPRASIKNNVKGAQTQMTLTPETYDPILDLLADHRPKAVGELEQALAGRMGLGDLLTALIVLLGEGSLSPAGSDEEIEAARPACLKLNRRLLDRARSSDEVGFLACPANQGAVLAPRFQQVFAMAVVSGFTEPSDWAAFAWETLKSQNQKLMRNGAPVGSDEDGQAALVEQAQAFGKSVLPMWRALGVI